MDSDSSESSGKMPSPGCQPIHLKRKRRSSEQNSDNDCDIENLPTNEEKKFKEDSRVEPSCSFERENDRRQPFSELKIVLGSQESNIESPLSDQERLSSNEEVDTVSIVSSCDVARLSDLSPDTESNIVDSSPCFTPASNSLTSYAEFVSPERFNPLPPLEWADLPSLWQMMCEKDEQSLRSRDPDMFSRHPNLQPRMRSVLLDWLSEVCEVYKFHRDTYYMAMDYLDRFLSTKIDVPKQQLQLIGITCLQIATKNEEIYPPKMSEYAYVTDGACTQKEIITKELVICMALKWKLNPVTPIYWLNLFMQISYEGKARHNLGFYFPQFSAKLYNRAAHLLNLCTLDVGSLRFSYSILAATAFSLTFSPQLAIKVTGYDEDDLTSCIFWMTPFWEVLKKEVPEYKKKYNKLVPGFTKTAVFDDEHNLQKHDVSLAMLESVVIPEEIRQIPSCFMTPPLSNKKTSQDQTALP